MKDEIHVKDGPALAAILAAGLGCMVIGLLTVASEASEVVKGALNWWNPAGPLSGKTGTGVIVWLVSWIVFHFCWRDREINFVRVGRVAVVLILLGLLGTFPPFFELWAGHH